MNLMKKAIIKYPILTLMAMMLFNVKALQPKQPQ